jgi:hypothetical protein
MTFSRVMIHAPRASGISQQVQEKKSRVGLAGATAHSRAREYSWVRAYSPR